MPFHREKICGTENFPKLKKLHSRFFRGEKPLCAPPVSNEAQLALIPPYFTPPRILEFSNSLIVHVRCSRRRSPKCGVHVVCTIKV